MHIFSKIAVAVVAMAIVSIFGFAQAPQQGQGGPMMMQSGPGGRMAMPGGGMGSQGQMGPMCMCGQDMGPQGQMGGMGMRGQGMGRQGQGGRMDMRGRGMGQRGFGLQWLLNNPNARQQIGVTDAQVAKIRQQQSDFQKAEIRNRADLQVKRMDLRDLLSADKPDRSAIDRKLQEVGAAQLAVEKSAIDYRLNMRDAITPDQREKLQQMMRQRRRPMPMNMPGMNMPGMSMPGGNAAPRNPPGGGLGGRGAMPPPNGRGQASQAPANQ